jgi:hypothetical protein
MVKLKLGRNYSVKFESGRPKNGVLGFSAEPNKG